MHKPDFICYPAVNDRHWDTREALKSPHVLIPGGPGTCKIMHLQDHDQG